MPADSFGPQLPGSYSPKSDGGIARRYRPGTLVLETEFETETGHVAVIDFMPPGDGAHVVRIVKGLAGRVEMGSELVIRFNYGATVPWVDRLDDGTISALAGPDRVALRTAVPLVGEDLKTVGDFSVEGGTSRSFVLSHGPSNEGPPPAIDAHDALTRTETFWCEWSSRCPVGLLAEEVDPVTGRMLGNFPQAYSHVGLINCALNLSRQTSPPDKRADPQSPIPVAAAAAADTPDIA